MWPHLANRDPDTRDAAKASRPRSGGSATFHPTIPAAPNAGAPLLFARCGAQPSTAELNGANSRSVAGVGVWES